MAVTVQSTTKKSGKTPSQDFAGRLLAWFDHHGRKDLPWQKNISPYRVWLSEIMLQQTQVTTVIPYFERFTGTYPDINALAAAAIDDVLHLWTGLGYYARARNLHKTARIIAGDCAGQFPQSVDALSALPGIGRSTAGAIVSIAFGERAVILDGNVKRVLARHKAIPGWPGQTATHNQLWQIAEALTPSNRHGDYTQAIMDLGATLCTRSKPICERCPVGLDCQARQSATQHLYPGKKAKKALPVKQTLWLVIRNSAGQMLLENRPPVGIWGGLWTFPDVDNHSDITNRCRELGLQVGNTAALTTRRHTFSHFHLDFTPIIVEASPLPAVRDKHQLQWLDANNLAGYGTPAPVKKLLQELGSQLKLQAC